MSKLRVLADGSVIAAGAKLPPDYYGFLSLAIDPDDTDLLEIDWTGFLGSETISSAAWTATSLTLASAATSGATTSVKVSAAPVDTYGTAAVLLTTSGGRVKTLSVRFYGRDA